MSQSVFQSRWARCGLAVAAVAAGLGLRLALIAWVGPGLPMYLTFYPAVMAVALLAGFGPGLLATILTAGVVDYWFFEPAGFGIGTPLDRVATGLFLIAGVFICEIMRRYRRKRDEAAAYERELALRESREALRRQAELIDPIRAELIAGEMQRAVRERGKPPAVPTPPASWLRRVPTVAGAAIITIGVLVLSGWSFKVSTLKSFLPGLAGMKPNAALCFVLTGLALTLRRRRAIRLASAALAGLAAGLTLVEYVKGFEFGIDQLLFRDVLDLYTVHPGRMVPATAVGFILGCASLFLLAARTRTGRRTQQALALGTVLTGLYALLGYLYSVALMYGFAGAAPMALPTSVGLMALGFGLLSARPDGWLSLLAAGGPGAQMARRFLPVAALLPVALGLLHRYGELTGWVESPLGTGLFVLVIMLALLAAIWSNAKALNRTDASRRETETQLRNQAELIDQAGEALIVRELGGGIRSWNRGAELLYGWSAAEAVGQPIHALLRTSPASLVEISDAALAQAGRWEGELVHATRDGRQLTVDAHQTATLTGDGRVLVLESLRDITARQQAEETLRQSEERFRALNETSPIGVGVSSTDGLLLYVNPAYESLLGYDRGELPGKKASDLYLNPGDRASWIKEMKEGRPVENLEIRLKRKDGAPIWASISTADIFYGGQQAVMGTIEDITQRKRAEELRQALAEQEKLRLGAAVEQASDSIVMVDLDGTIRYVNAAFESINGMARAAAAGTSYFDLLAGEPAAAAAIREAVAAGRPWYGPLTRAVRDARPVELEVTISPAKDPSGAVIGGLISEKDVTRENALQNQVRQAQKMEALGTLAGGITHDFNNILGTIIINTELALLDLDPTDPARQNLPLVLRAANRGKELVKQIITFSRQRTWERKPHEIAPLIKEDLKFLRSTLPKDIGIQEMIDARSGVVLADSSHVHQVFVNLCQNAALAMKDGGGRLGVSLAPVEVDEAMTARHPNLKPGPYVRLTVSDTGCGMTKEVRERIFEPFFTTRGPGEGSGLGLAVVLGIVRTYDGEITVDSEPEEGSTFNVYFPRLEGEKPAADAEDRTGPLRGEERILLVEDEKNQRESLERGLGRLGYRITARADGRSALAAFKKDPAAFDLVITDQVMPKLTGLELAAAISALRPDLPVILCTGFSEKVNGEIVGKSGVRDFIMKPYTIRDLTTLIRKVLAETAAPTNVSK